MEGILMGSVVYFCIFTLISYVLFIIKAPILIIPSAIVLIYLGLRKTHLKINLNFQTILTIIVFLLGIIGQMAVISPSGRIINGDLVFWSSHGHDATWHIALMNELKNDFPFQNPSFANERLVNYHFFSDVLPAIVSKIIPHKGINFDLNLYFRFFPFLYSLFLGSSAYFLTKKLTDNNFAANIWATIFTYFAGSWGYLIGKGESVFWATQPQSASGNPPQIISDFLVLSLIYFAISYSKNRRRWDLFSSIIILGTLIEFKVYAAIVMFGGILISGLWQILIPAAIIAGTLYLPNAISSTSFLIFQPWWYIRTMVVEPSRLNLIDWELRRQTYLAYHNYKWVIFYETLAFLIFFFGNLGMRFLGLLEFLKTNKLIRWSIVISIILPLLFLQKGVASNTAQFLQYFVLLMGILAGIGTQKLTFKFKLLIPFIIILMVPTQVNLLKDFYSRGPFAKITKEEIAALNFLKENTPKDTVIITPPYDQYLDLKESTPNIWDWFDTSYVAAFSERKTYMDDYEQADIMGYNYKKRLAIKEIIFKSTDQKEVNDTISKTKANIIYFPNEMKPKVDMSKLNLTKIFENQTVTILKID